MNNGHVGFFRNFREAIQEALDLSGEWCCPVTLRPYSDDSGWTIEQCDSEQAATVYDHSGGNPLGVLLLGVESDVIGVVFKRSSHE